MARQQHFNFTIEDLQERLSYVKLLLSSAKNLYLMVSNPVLLDAIFEALSLNKVSVNNNEYSYFENNGTNVVIYKYKYATQELHELVDYCLASGLKILILSNFHFLTDKGLTIDLKSRLNNFVFKTLL